MVVVEEELWGWIIKNGKIYKKQIAKKKKHLRTSAKHFGTLPIHYIAITKRMLVVLDYESIPFIAVTQRIQHHIINQTTSTHTHTQTLRFTLPNTTNEILVITQQLLMKI